MKELLILPVLMLLGSVYPSFAIAEEQSKWRYSESTSPMDNSKGVNLELEAENDIQGWLKTFHPVLAIRCQENRTEILILTGMSATPEYGSYNEYTVRIRLDEKRAFREQWSNSTNNEALFAPRPVQLAKNMAKAKTMLFEFTPYNANPATITFDLSGIDTLLPKVASACRWKP